MDGLGLSPVPASRSPLSARAFGSEVLLGELIGRGGMSRVYRGWLRGSGVEVAVKVLRDDLAGRPEAVQRFVRERDLLSAVASPHVVRVHELVVQGDELGIVMDLVPGGHLRRAVSFPCPPRAAAELTVQIAEGLAAVHATGVIHRDLKPENVLVDSDDSGAVLLRLTDFGISRLVDAAQLTQTSVTGTPGYLAPEVAAGARPGAAADVYALGVVLYELCTGRGPFLADNPLVLVLAHTRMPPPRPGGMPDPLWALLSAMLAKDPAARPTAAQVADGLRALVPALDGVPTCTPPEPSAPSAVTSPPTSPVAPATSPVASPAIAAGVPPSPGSPEAQAWTRGLPGGAPGGPGWPGPAGGPPAGTAPLWPAPQTILRPFEPGVVAPSRRSARPPVGPGPRPIRERLPEALRRPPVLGVAATGALLVVVLAVLGVRALRAGPDTVTPVPAPAPVSEPTLTRVSVPALPPPSPTVAPRTVVAVPSPRASAPAATKGSTTSARPSPTPTPDVPTLARSDSTPADLHSSDRQVRLTIGGVKVNAGTLASVTVRYDDGGVYQVPLSPPDATSYQVTIDGLTNGREYRFEAEVCSSTTNCARSAPFAFTPYGAPQIRRPGLSVNGMAVTVTWSPVDRNAHPGRTQCVLTVDGTPGDAGALRRDVAPSEGGSQTFTGRPLTSYVATESCSTDEVSDGSESSSAVVTGPAPSPSPTVSASTSASVPAGAA